MNRKIVAYFVSWILFIEGLCMLIPVITAAFYKEKCGWIFLIVGLICIIIAKVMQFYKPDNNTFYTREGFVSVGLGWLVMSMMGAVPFVIDGCIPNYIDALFEVVSGFTTTGATILNDVEALPKSMLMWRSFSHWLGGMGILMFILAIMPNAGNNNMHIVRAESPGPTAGKFVSSTKLSAFILYFIYTIITLTEIILLLIGGMPVYDSIIISLGTVGTGGFGHLNDSCGSFSAYQQIIITIFMLLCGTNFNVYFLMLSKKFKDVFKSEEVKVYYIIVGLSSIFITANIMRQYDNNVFVSFRHAAFQVASIITTTGYSTVDFDLWPTFSKTVLVTLMFIGACAGSTGGGMKVSRIIIAFKTIGKELTTMIHPRNIKILKFEGKAIDHSVLRSVNTYIMTYGVLFVGAMLIVSLDGFDYQTTFTAITATFNNIGPGIGGVGPMCNYSQFSYLSKIVMTFAMLAGRLELYPMLLLFNIRTWKKSL